MKSAKKTMVIYLIPALIFLLVQIIMMTPWVKTEGELFTVLFILTLVSVYPLMAIVKEMGDFIQISHSIIYLFFLLAYFGIMALTIYIQKKHPKLDKWWFSVASLCATFGVYALLYVLFGEDFMT